MLKKDLTLEVMCIYGYNSLVMFKEFKLWRPPQQANSACFNTEFTHKLELLYLS